ncbi:SDR family NAD(P)-dependent oxidoreductase [Rhodoligotrophos appendicifer]|uniref:SDR family NAD(P)-dependent oxidoreductase n=1 Tax=Rhodoligotrophos appendicifer TaxID=987056 RepID=UPI001FE6E08D|nr:SDR family oxidoreductase [Rhodoligotrophos appendicifer]
MGLEGKIALITGGARGIGFAAAQILAAEGVKLALVDINGDAAAAAAQSLTGTEAIGIRADISSEADVAAMVAAATERFGRIDIFVNSAAVLDDKLFLDSGPADWSRMLNVCLLGPMLCLRHILPGMVERGHGRVICLASDSARVGQARLSYYAAAKAGVIALVKSVAQEVGKGGVTLNVVSPGATNTPLRIEREDGLRAQMGEEKYARRVNSVLKMYPAGRIGEPDDIGSAIVFLASDRASWITGQVLSVNGGFVMP